MQANRIVRIAISAVLALLGLGIVLAFFDRLPLEGSTLAMDWRGLWLGLEGGIPKYGNESFGLRIPPWSVLVMLPFGLLPPRASWGLLTVLTLAVLILSVPKAKSRVVYWLSVFLLVGSFPAMRTIADGNLEFLVIGGILLALYGYEKQNPLLLAVGYLLAATKIQETWIFLAILPIYLLGSWPAPRWRVALLIALAISVPTLLWRGNEWLRAASTFIQRGSIMDSSLSATMYRLNAPRAVLVALWLSIFLLAVFLALKTRGSMSREKAAMLVAASLLLAPYAAGNSYLTVYAIGVIPLFQSARWAGTGLILLANLPYLALGSFNLMYFWSATYWCCMLLLTWCVLAHRIYRSEMTGFRLGRKMPPAQPDSLP